MFMIASGEWIEPTRFVGLVAYGTALTCCALTWARAKSVQPVARLAAVLTIIQATLLLDMAFNWRWKLHQAFLEAAMRRNEYDQRSLPQLETVSLLVVVLLIGFLVAWRLFRNRGTTLIAVWGTMASIVLWCVEVVSLHAVDHVLYSSIIGIKAVSVLWILSCTMTSIGILVDPR